MKAVLVDTGFIIALLNRSDQFHTQCVQVINEIADPLITCEAVITESCYMLRRSDGAADEILQNVRDGVFQIPFVLCDRAAEVSRLLKKCADVPMDFADACLVDLATQAGTRRILTLDSDFKVYRWGRNRPFEILLDVG